MAAYENQDTPGLIESLLRGTSQGATLGFGDEWAGLAGALGAMTTPEGRKRGFAEWYRQARDEARQKNLAAEEAHPVAYKGADFVSSILLPIPGAAVTKASTLGGRVLSNVARAAPGAAVRGAGYSGGDVFQDPLGVAKDVAATTALGAGLAGSVPLAAAGISKATPAAKQVAQKVGKLFEDVEGRGIPASQLAGAAGGAYLAKTLGMDPLTTGLLSAALLKPAGKAVGQLAEKGGKLFIKSQAEGPLRTERLGLSPKFGAVLAGQSQAHEASIDAAERAKREEESRAEAASNELFGEPLATPNVDPDKLADEVFGKK